MIRRLIVIASVSIVSLACASAPHGADAGDPREKDETFRYGRNPGPSPVGVIPDIVLNDPQRNRDVMLTVEYPTRGGSHPLIVFSHGGGGSNRGYPGLSSHWTSYEYVVIRPAHNDRAEADEMTVTQWRERARDITFILDSLPTLAQRYPELEGKIDATRIAVAGHSRGAVTAMMLGGLRTFPGPASYADPRVKAVVAMSPAGPRETWGVTTESWMEVRLPVLFMTGSMDMGTMESETPLWRQQAFELSPAGDKWLVTIEGVRAGTFTGQAGAIADDGSRTRPTSIPMDPRRDPRNDPNVSPQDAQRQQMARARMSGSNERELFGMIRSLALAFFDAYLKEDAKGREYLRETDARANVEVRTK